MHPSETMNPGMRSAACKAASEPDPAIRANNRTEAAVPACSNRGRVGGDTPWRRARPAPVDEALSGSALDPPGVGRRARHSC